MVPYQKYAILTEKIISLPLKLNNQLYKKKIKIDKFYNRSLGTVSSIFTIFFIDFLIFFTILIIDTDGARIKAVY